MNASEISAILERLARLEAEVSQLTALVNQLPPSEANAVRESGEAYTVQKKFIEQTEHPHIVRIPEVDGGTPLIRGPYKTVWAVVELHQRGMSAEEIVEAFREEQEVKLTLAEVYSALSFYFDNKEELDKTLADKLAKREEQVQWFLKMKFGPKDPNAPPPPPLPPHEPKPVLETDHPHIIRVPGKSGGDPLTGGQINIGVRIIIGMLRQGMTPAEIATDYAPSLTLAEVYDALSYYYDHLEEMEAIIAGHVAAGDEGRRISYAQQVAYAKRRREENAR